MHYLKKLSFFLLTLLAISLGSCKHDTDPVIPIDTPIDQAGPVTGIGQPQGEAISKVIGPEGGSLVAADGKVSLAIPAGALAKETTISIQPITNQAQNGLGLAYRFLPDGTQFAKPATLTFRYDASLLASSEADLLQIAYQATNRQWYWVPGRTIDSTHQQISVPMPHFSDWSAYEIAEIEQLDIVGGPSKGKYLDFNQSTNLAVSYARLAPLVPDSKDKPLDIKHITWSVVGGAANGQIRSEGEKAVYTAPGKYPPQNPVTVVAEVTFTNSDKKVLLLMRIVIGKDYFTGTFGGEHFDWHNLFYNYVEGTFLIAGWHEDETQSLNVLISPRDINNPKGSYRYKADVPKAGDGSAFVEFAHSYGGMDGYLSYMYPCGDNHYSPPPIVSSGQVTITQVDVVDGIEYIKGRLTATLYNLPGPCPTPLVDEIIEAEFRIHRAH